MHEWAKLRWGVHEEYGYPGDERFPMFYYKTSWGPSGQVRSTSCTLISSLFQVDILKPNFCTSTEVLGVARDVVSGGPCTDDSAIGLPNNHCYFYPDADNTVGSSYMALPFLDSVTDFCDDISEDNIHHDQIPTKQNLYCNGKSTWTVITENEDFNGGANPPVDITDTTPVFRLVKPEQSAKYVVVIDISYSMMTGPHPPNPDMVNVRSSRMKDAVKRWVMFEVADGTEVALVVFSNVQPSSNPIIFNMAAVDDAAREGMVKAVDDINFIGQTCIGCGIDRALNWPGTLKGSDGGVMILITDGEQNCETSTGCLTIQDMTQEVLARKTRVVTIAFGLDADPALEELALKSGGKSYFIDDYSGAGTINDAFTGSLTYQPEEVLGNTNIVVHQKDYRNVNSGSTIAGYFDIDVSIGRDVSFQVEVTKPKGADCAAPVDILLISPNDDHTFEINNETFTCSSDNFKIFQHKISGLAEEGRWVYLVISEEDLDSLSVKVESKSRDASTDPVMTRCWLSTGGQEIDTTTNVKLAVLAEVSQGSRAVVGAKVRAEVERPANSDGEPQPPIELELMDNGGGADRIKNDGTYSRSVLTCSYDHPNMFTGTLPSTLARGATV